MPTGNLAILDTSVYIENFRTGRFTARLVQSPWIIRCSAVVVHELRRGARSMMERRFVSELVHKVRMVTPMERHWIESAEILAQMQHRQGYKLDKLRDLAFDALIALSAREIGATLITCDHDDFTDIHRYKSFKVAYW